MFPQSLMRLYDGVGGGRFQDKPDPAGHRTPPQIFYAREFFEKIIWRKNKHGKTTESPPPT